MIIFEKLIPEVNIGLVGHVDHGKTTLTQALTGKWTDTHSEELKRGITIRLGYADATFYFCEKCKKYTNQEKCDCNSKAIVKRSVSFVDAPGHETLMATVLSGASLMDGALLLIAADEKCPQPQTAEHLKALDVVGIKNIIIVQNKIDIVSKEQAIKNYKEIKAFTKGTVAENAPIIPISSVHQINIDRLIEVIENTIKTPKRDLEADPRFYIARSFDINSPGAKIDKLMGGVVGGSLTKGKLKKGEEIEIRPGAFNNNSWKPLKTKIRGVIQAGKREDAIPGGLVAIETFLDPAITKSDNLSGNVIGYPDKLPVSREKMKMKVNLFDHVIGVSGNQKVKEIKTGDTLMLTVAIAKTVGFVNSSAKSVVDIDLKIPVCADCGDKVAISMQVGGRWHLIGWGEVLKD
ncbi:translation initiation factor IF-2 subunit gamma [Candidatus Aenigmatarchaeota archaeon]